MLWQSMQTSLVIGTNEESIFTVRQILQGNLGTPRRAGLDGCTLTPGRQCGDDVTRICDALAAGQQVHVSATGLGIAGGKIKHLAEKNICPKYLPVPAQVLMTFSGSGIRNSAPFQVGSQVTVKYDFNCSSIGGRGNFIADLQYGNQSSLNSDDQQIANSLGATGAQTTTVYPQDPGKPYYLAVNSECSWHVKVTGSH